MNRKRLSRVKREIWRLRRATAKTADLQALAASLGRKRNTKRGKEPMWESTAFGNLFPLSIPMHGGGRDIPPGTKNSMLDQLEEDVFAWEERLDAEEEDDLDGEETDDAG